MHQQCVPVQANQQQQQQPQQVSLVLQLNPPTSIIQQQPIQQMIQQGHVTSNK